MSDRACGDGESAPSGPADVAVELLYSPGCGRRRELADRVRDAGRRADVAVSLAETVVETQSQALAQRFVGSPSLRVRGRDLEPSADELRLYGLGRRTCSGPGR
jgi:hypothetical protein